MFKISFRGTFRLLCLQNDAAEFTIAVATAVTIVELPIKLSRNFLVAKNFVKLVRRSQIQLEEDLPLEEV